VKSRQTPVPKRQLNRGRLSGWTGSNARASELQISTYGTSGRRHLLETVLNARFGIETIADRLCLAQPNRS
jgi:hypothetical protein